MTAPGLTAAVEGIAHNKGELFASFDVDAFEVPHGRDEIWRFTPLRRLRGLHDGSARATGSATITVSERPGVYTRPCAAAIHDWARAAYPPTALPPKRFRRSTPRLWSPSSATPRSSSR